MLIFPDRRIVFANQKKKIDHEEFGTYLLKSVMAVQHITSLLPTQCSKRYSSGPPDTFISSHKSQLLCCKSALIR